MISDPFRGHNNNIIKWYLHQEEFILEKKTQNSLGFWGMNRSQNPRRQPDRVLINKKKYMPSCRCCSDWPKNEDKRNKKDSKYLDLARELRKLWYISLVVIPLVDGTIRTVRKDWEKNKRNWLSEVESKPSKLPQCWEWWEYWAESSRPEDICCHWETSERPPALAGVKIANNNNNNNNNNDYIMHRYNDPKITNTSAEEYWIEPSKTIPTAQSSTE